MKWADVDWSVVRVGLVAMLLALATGLLLLQTGIRFRADQAAQYQIQQGRFLAVSRKYFSIDDDRRVVTELYPRFLELQRKGVIGQEQRLNWYEVLRRLGTELVPNLNYQVLSRESYAPSYPLPGGPFQVNTSLMKLEMELLHEQDLIKVLRTLERDGAGLFSVDRCELQAMGPTTSTQRVKPHLRVACDLHWFTLTLRSGKELSPP